MDNKKIDFLKEKATILRKHVIEMVGRQGQGYVQQGLGASDIFSVLFFEILNLDFEDAKEIKRDRFFLSTAHNSAVFHACLAERGLIDNVEATCGSLGQGLSVAIGMALTAVRKDIGSRFYVILGDGELQEGQTWEAIMSAAFWKLSNLCLIVDCNDMQVEGNINNVMSLEPLNEKFDSFGWNTITCDGNDIKDLLSSFEKTKNVQNFPSVILAKTLVGKGVPFLEGQLSHNLVFPEHIAKKALKIFN